MNDTSAEIERIVRRVVAELRAGESVRRETASDGAERKPELVIPERVVTLAILDGRLNGAAVVKVKRGAVVTPAVRDELKARNIRLEFADNPGRGGARNSVELIVGIADIPDDVSLAVRNVEGHVAGLAKVQAMQGADLAALIERMSETIAAGRSLGVVLTRRPAAAVCVANRRRGVRAVWGCGAPVVAEAVQTIAPNLLTYNPAVAKAFEQRGMLREFVQGGVRDCPEAFRDILV